MGLGESNELQNNHQSEIEIVLIPSDFSEVMSMIRRSPSPSPTVTLDISPKQELVRSASEDSIRVVHHAVVFPPSSPLAGRVNYIRRSFESDQDIIRRQLAAIALQPLTFAEELAAKRKQLEQKAEKRKREKAQAQASNKIINPSPVPEIKVAPPSGENKPPPRPPRPAAVKETRTVGKNPSRPSPQKQSPPQVVPPPPPTTQATKLTAKQLKQNRLQKVTAAEASSNGTNKNIVATAGGK